jgi:hypothetical protein
MLSDMMFNFVLSDMICSIRLVRHDVPFVRRIEHHIWQHNIEHHVWQHKIEHHVWQHELNISSDNTNGTTCLTKQFEHHVDNMWCSICVVRHDVQSCCSNCFVRHVAPFVLSDVMFNSCKTIWTSCRQHELNIMSDKTNWTSYLTTRNWTSCLTRRIEHHIWQHEMCCQTWCSICVDRHDGQFCVVRYVQFILLVMVFYSCCQTWCSIFIISDNTKLNIMSDNTKLNIMSDNTKLNIMSDNTKLNIMSDNMNITPWLTR